MKTRIIVLAAAALAALSCGNRNGNTQAGPAGFGPQANVTPNVEVISATSKDVAQESSYSSTVEAFATNNIMPQAGGRIRKINAEVGDYMTKGQVLAEMDRL